MSYPDPSSVIPENSSTMIVIFIISTLAILAIILVFKYAAGCKPIGDFIVGKDGAPSLSQFQFLLWTLVVSFTFLSMQIIVLIETHFNPPPNLQINKIPDNLLALMGISIAVPIISSKINSDAAQSNESDTSMSFRRMFQNEYGKMDLARFQMFLWTIISIGVFLYTVYGEVTDPNVNTIGFFLPDISPTMLILMGLSQGAYLGSKYASSQSGSQENQVHAKM